MKISILIFMMPPQATIQRKLRTTFQPPNSTFQYPNRRNTRKTRKTRKKKKKKTTTTQTKRTSSPCRTTPFPTTSTNLSMKVLP